MNDPILTDLLEKVAARLIETNIDYLRHLDEAENIQTGGNRDSASDLDYIYQNVAMDVENNELIGVLMEKVAIALGLDPKTLEPKESK